VKSHNRKTPKRSIGPRRQVVRRKTVKPTNIIMVGPGGSAHVHSGFKRPTGNHGYIRKFKYGNTHVRGRSIFAERKTRKNKGTKRLVYGGMSPSLFK
jgi:hypothetical protein